LVSRSRWRFGSVSSSSCSNVRTMPTSFHMEPDTPRFSQGQRRVRFPSLQGDRDFMLLLALAVKNVSNQEVGAADA
jgi:hypothetical protein